MPTLKSKIETLLFLSPKPLSYKKLEQLTVKPLTEVKEAISQLIAEYESKGMQIMQSKESIQMVTAPENAKLAKELVKDEQTGELSKPALETLTIVAYRGPITKAELDQIRGVNCSLILRNLMIKGLVEAKDNKDKMAIVYNVTFDFMRYLGITKIEDLPDYEKLNSDENLQRLLEIRQKETKTSNSPTNQHSINDQNQETINKEPGT